MKHAGALIAIMGLLAWNACDDEDERFVPDDGCVDGDCVCRDTPECDQDCQGPGCNLSCEQASDCDGLCDDTCDFTCRDVSNCTVACAASCTIVCDRVSNCTGSCGDGCDVTCRDLSNCDIVMGPGSIGRCEAVSNCDLRCSDDVSPTDCGDGVVVCPPAACP